MKETFPSNINRYYFYCLITVLLIIFVLFFPILNFLELHIKIQVITLSGNALIISTIIIIIADMLLLLIKKINLEILIFFTMIFSITVFLLMEYSFLNDLFDIVYVWRYSSVSQSIIFKLVGIWAGQSGSIMTWMVLNTIVLFFYRIKSPFNKQTKDYDPIFNLSCIIGLLILAIFLFILIFQDPFQICPPYINPNGLGLSAVLLSPFMIWHPLFTFLAYAIFLIPFSIVLAELILLLSRKIINLFGRKTLTKYELKNHHQNSSFNFSLRLGWLILTLSIGLGAIWASLSWGRYWGWDPVETVSLLPWVFCIAYLHSISFQKTNPKLLKINILLLFLSIVFSTLITRGGGLGSLHNFTGSQDLLFWLLLNGLILIILTLYVLNDALSNIIEKYKKKRLLLDYLSYFFLFSLCFILIIGLYFPLLTLFLGNFFPINPIYLGANYYNFLTIIPAIGLSLSLIFCSLMDQYKIKNITIVLLILIGLSTLISFFTNPAIIAILIFILSAIATLISIIKQFNPKKGVRYFFKTNTKELIHIGISMIFIGMVIEFPLWQDFVYMLGFNFLLIGIIPSIIFIFFKPKKEYEFEKELPEGEKDFEI